MKASSGLKMTMIGGGSRIGGAVLLQLLNRECSGLKEVVLYGRTMTNIENNIKLADIVCPPIKRTFEIVSSNCLDNALDGADIVFYNATAGLESFGGYDALGVAQGAHIMYIAETISKLCPHALLLVNTNPTDIPLSAVKKRFNLDKLIGLCNASVITRKVLSAYLETDEEELQLYEIGVNHDLWFYEISLKGKQIYDHLRQKLPKEYSHLKVQSDYLFSFPEWREAFKNNIEILKSTNYLSSPVGGSDRFTGLPLSNKDISKMMKRPTREDFQSCISENADRDRIFKVTSRCGGGIPIYIADVIETILSDSNKQCSIQVLNKGALPDFPDDVLLQMTCRFSGGNIVRPEIKNIPEYIIGTLATKILQNNLSARALAEQDDKLMLQSLLMTPERIGVSEAQNIIFGSKTF